MEGYLVRAAQELSRTGFEIVNLGLVVNAVISFAEVRKFRRQDVFLMAECLVNMTKHNCSKATGVGLTHTFMPDGNRIVPTGDFQSPRANSGHITHIYASELRIRIVRHRTSNLSFSASHSMTASTTCLPLTT